VKFKAIGKDGPVLDTIIRLSQDDFVKHVSQQTHISSVTRQYNLVWLDSTDVHIT